VLIFCKITFLIAVCLLLYIVIELLVEKWKEGDMSVKEFIKEVTLQEGKKVSLSIAQVAEVLKIANELLDGELYKLIKRVKG
jgi:TRAP-type mannitol/chloroaromatic compound transport system permease small subunit